MRQTDRGHLNLHLSPINSSTNSQNQQENRLWKMRFWAYFRWSIFFFNSQCSTTKTIERKSRKHAKLWSKKIEEFLNSILLPLIALTTLRIHTKIDFQKWDFQHIFDDPSFFKGVWRGEGYVNSESSDCDVSACAWYTDAWSGSTYEQSEQVLALWIIFVVYKKSMICNIWNSQF